MTIKPSSLVGIYDRHPNNSLLMFLWGSLVGGTALWLIGMIVGILGARNENHARMKLFMPLSVGPGEESARSWGRHN